MTNAAYGQKLFSENAKGPSQYYKWWWPCWEGEGTDVIDHHCDSATGDCTVQNAEVDTGNAGAWNSPNDGWIVSDNGQANGSAIQVQPAEMAHLDTSREEIWLFAHWYKSVSSPTTHFGCTNSPTGGVPGFRTGHSAVDPYPFTCEFGDGVASTNKAMGNVALDTPTHVMLVFDCASKKFHGWLNGQVSFGDEDFPGAPFADFDLSENTYGLAYGSQNSGSLGRDAQFRDIHHLVFPSLPTNLSAIARFLYLNPYTLLSASEISL